MLRSTALMLALAVAIAACPGPGANQPTGPVTTTGDVVINPGVPPDLSALKLQLNQAFCNALVDCPPTSSAGQFAFLFDNASDCASSLTYLGDNALVGVEEALARGTVVYDATVAQACLATIAGPALCTGRGGILANACEGAFVGTLSEGDTCYSGVECASGLYCDDNVGCPGVCAPQKSAGEFCSSSSECAYSGSGEGVADCSFGGGCVNVDYDPVPAAVGQPCGLLGAAPDLREVLCQSGAHCLEDGDSEAGTCVATVAVGAPCQLQQDVCDGNAQCIPGDNTCRAVALVKTAGGGCGPADVALCDPFSRLYCDQATATCQPFGDGSIGAACPSNFFFDVPGVLCNEGGYCDSATNTCVAVKADGESCLDPEECLSGTCDFGTGTCTSAPQCTN